jgi:uncharacterized protein (UPF0276 family)
MNQGPTAGLGLKPQYYAEASASRAAGLWFEIHPENYFCEGGPRLAWLEAIRREHPLSLHGVGLSLASAEGLDPEHLASLRRLADRFEPFVVSEHLAWTKLGDGHFPDLFPFPRTREALEIVAANISRAQHALARPILIENPSVYARLDGHELEEPEFLEQLARRTGCGLLVDVNNVFVSANNLGFDAGAYIDALPPELVSEIHLAGHCEDQALGARLLIDSHGSPVSEPVWALYARLIARTGPRPTLIERDQNIPDFEALMGERDRAQAALEHAGRATGGSIVRKELAHA